MDAVIITPAKKDVKQARKFTPGRNRNFTLETRSLRNQKSMVSFILNY